MSTYTLIRKDDVLYHYGVKGMRWGQRRAQKRETRINRTISKLGTQKKNNRNWYDEAQAESQERYGHNAKKLKKVQASNKAAFDTTETINNYSIAKQKAKLDKNYKNSAEYKSAKSKYNKVQTQTMLLGTVGHQRVESLKNQGKSGKAAVGRVATEQILAGAAIGAAFIVAGKLING